MSNALRYAEFLRKTERIDLALKRFVVGKLGRDHKHFDKLMQRLEKMAPDIYKKIHEGVVLGSRLALDGDNAEWIKDFGWQIAKDIENIYQCDAGFSGKEVPKPFTVYIWGEKRVEDVSAPHKAIQSQLAEKYGGKRVWTFGHDNRICTCQLTESAAKALAKDKYVRKVVEEPIATIMYGDYAPVPPYNAAAENIDWGTSLLNPSYAWAKGIKGAGIKVCVIDTGIDAIHTDLYERYKGGYNFVAGTDNPTDDHGHGTACAGIICASEGSGYVGLAPEADLYVCKVLNAKGGGSLDVIAAGVDWARTNGMDVISLSLGASGAACTGILADAILNAWGAGLIIVVSAGNDGENCPGDDCVAMPGNCTASIGVAAMDVYGNPSLFSSRGPEIELTAPGEGITSARAGGFDMYNDGGLHFVGDSWQWWNGTSASCPQVAGAAVLIKCWYPDATNLQIRQWLRDNAVDV